MSTESQETPASAASKPPEWFEPSLKKAQLADRLGITIHELDAIVCLTDKFTTQDLIEFWRRELPKKLILRKRS